MKDEQIEDIVQILLNNFKIVEEEFEKYEKGSASEKMECSQKLERLKSQIDEEMTIMKKQITIKRLVNYENTFNEFEERRNEQERILEEITNNSKSKDGKGRASVQEVLFYGDELYQKAIEKGENILQTLKDANQIMVDIEEEVYQQRLKLLRTRDLIKDSQDIMKRSKEILNFFTKMLAKDTFIRILVVVMFVLLIGIVLFMTLCKSTEKEENAIKKNIVLAENKILSKEKKTDDKVIEHQMSNQKKEDLKKEVTLKKKKGKDEEEEEENEEDDKNKKTSTDPENSDSQFLNTTESNSSKNDKGTVDPLLDVVSTSNEKEIISKGIKDEISSETSNSEIKKKKIENSTQKMGESTKEVDKGNENEENSQKNNSNDEKDNLKSDSNASSSEEKDKKDESKSTTNDKKIKERILPSKMRLANNYILK